MQKSTLSVVDLSIFSSRIEAVCEEMGAVLQRTAFSPNIKDRLDFSCAVFDARGELCAQAAHIPVHMGSMAYAMRDIVLTQQWEAGDMVILNDPYLGGTHLPDVTLIAPTFIDEQLAGFVVNRAHHADIGSDTPGSMPISSSLHEEGIIIPPTKIISKGIVIDSVMDAIVTKTSQPEQSYGDFAAQISANRTGNARLELLIREMSFSRYQAAVIELNDYTERLARTTLGNIPNGEYQFTDVMDNDGIGGEHIDISVVLRVLDNHVEVDFAGTAAQTRGNINCPLSVAAAGVYYVFSCLLPDYAPTCQGRFRRIKISAPEGCLVNAIRPAAVAAGNVETSMRIVDVVMGALAQAVPEEIPAASEGSMNNIAMGARVSMPGVSRQWDYYETIGGGMGGGPRHEGISAIQTHMTNTRNTPIEVMESLYPLRVRQYAVRRGSGGKGKHTGGDGIVREFEFLEPAMVTLLTERRLHAPWGLNGGEGGAVGVNSLNGKSVGPKATLQIEIGDRLVVETPGGGGWG